MTKAGVAIVAGIAVIAAFYVYGSHGFPLSEPDEGRYGEIAREMLESGDWITPRLNYVPYVEKPPLVYWGTAAAFVAFGVSELAARLPSLLSGLGTIALTMWLAARMYGAATALLALPILALGPLFAILAQTLTLDMTLTFFMTLAMAAIWCGGAEVRRCGAGEEPPHRRTAAPPHARASAAPPAARTYARSYFRLAYLATAFAVLVKGPVAALLVGASGLLFLWLQGGWRAVRAALDWRAVALAALVTLPWFVLVGWRNPAFAHFYIVDQHIARYFWTHRHGQPIWYFVPVVPLALAPWGLLLLFDPALLRAALAPRGWTAATRFLVIWAAAIVGFFSLSSSKLPTYILPAMPPLALLAARAIGLGWARGQTIGLSRLAFLLLVGGPVMSLCGAVLPLVVEHWRLPIVEPVLIAGGALLLATGWLVRRALAVGRPRRALAMLAAGWLAGGVVAIGARGAANEYRALGVAAHAAMQPADRIALYRHFTHGIPFYAARRVIMVRQWGELDFGSRQGDQSAYFWPTDDQLRREWNAPGRLFLVINRAELAAMTPPLDPAPTVVAAKGKKLLVVNR